MRNKKKKTKRKQKKKTKKENKKETNQLMFLFIEVWLSYLRRNIS